MVALQCSCPRAGADLALMRNREDRRRRTDGYATDAGNCGHVALIDDQSVRNCLHKDLRGNLKKMGEANPSCNVMLAHVIVRRPG